MSFNAGISLVEKSVEGQNFHHYNAQYNGPIAFIPRSTMSRDTIERGTNAIGQLKTLEQTNKQCSEELNVLEDAKKLTSFISGFLLDHNLLVPRLVKWILILETSPTLTLIQFFKLWTRMDQFNSRFK